MDDLEYEALAWLAAGNSVFRPREATRDSEEAFRELIAPLARLKAKGLVDYQDRQVAPGKSGIYLMLGPVELTTSGKAALERDRRRAPRPRRSGDSLPWRS